MSRSIFKTITAKILTSDHLTNILYVAVSIIAMFVELKENDFRLNVDLEFLMLVKVASRDFNCSISLTDFSLNWLKESDFRLNWDVVKDLFSIWVEVKLFCFVIVLLLESRIIDFWLEVKFENQRKSIRISITRLILFIYVFSRIIWCWSNQVINIEAVSICNGCPFNNTRYIQRPNSNHYY